MNQRRHAAASIAILAGCLGLAAILDVTPQSAVLEGIQGPHCALRAFAGEGACPGCGLTRGTALALHGEVRAAWAAHPAGPLVVALCLAGVVLNLHVLLRGRRTSLHRGLFRAGHLLFLAGLVVGWLVR